VKFVDDKITGESLLARVFSDTKNLSLWFFAFWQIFSISESKAVKPIWLFNCRLSRCKIGPANAENKGLWLPFMVKKRLKRGLKKRGVKYQKRN